MIFAIGSGNYVFDVTLDITDCCQSQVLTSRHNTSSCGPVHIHIDVTDSHNYVV